MRVSAKHICIYDCEKQQKLADVEKEKTETMAGRANDV